MTEGSEANRHQQRKRYAFKNRRKRSETLLTQMGVLLFVGTVMVALSSGSRTEKRMWAEAQTGGVDSTMQLSSPGFGELSARRQLAHEQSDIPVIGCRAYLQQEIGNEPQDYTLCPGAQRQKDAENNTMYPQLGLDDGPSAVVQILVSLWMFLGLAIVCDSFFEAALSRICEAMSLKDDVAGATWMAAGGSAPELATSVLGVFISKSDVGFGTIVGSAVFNVLFVIACCAFVAPNLKLTWWPLARDASFYCFAMSMLVFVIADLKVEWYEALLLLLLYSVYILIMYYNEKLEAWVTGRVRLTELPGNGLQEGLKNFIKSLVRARSSPAPVLTGPCCRALLPA